MSDHPLDKSREIVERIVIEGTLVLKTPTHFGNGDTEGVTDMPLLRDEPDGRALLPGTSIAGALRNYLRERVLGFGSDQPDPDFVNALFGGAKGDNEGDQSCLIVEDAIGDKLKIELRDGVRIDPETRIAKIDQTDSRVRGYKFDLELLEAGTHFPLRFELVVPKGHSQRLRKLLAVALDALGTGEIALGLRKRRGFGCCFVPEWTVTHYDLCKPEGLLAWLAEGHDGWATPATSVSGACVADLLGVQLVDIPDERSLFHMKARFVLEGSLLIRSGFSQDDLGPDTVHLHSTQWDAQGRREPILSGTSLAGALRSRAQRILRTLAGETSPETASPSTHALLDSMFGPAEIAQGGRNARASRLIMSETVVKGAHSLVQNRIRIDRLTGGAFESALFNEQPVFGSDSAHVTVSLALRSPRKAEVGLLLLLLKDLWTGDLPLGGEASVGRGRLRGLVATLRWQEQEWTLAQESPDSALAIVGNPETLKECVAALRERIS